MLQFYSLPLVSLITNKKGFLNDFLDIDWYFNLHVRTDI